MLNTTCTRQIEFYLNHKKSHLLSLYNQRLALEALGFQDRLSRENERVLATEFIEVRWIAKKDLNDWLVNQWMKNNIGIVFKEEDDPVFVGLLSSQELQSILTSTVPEYENYINFIGQTVYYTARGSVIPGEGDRISRQFSFFTRDTVIGKPSYDSRNDIFTVASRLQDHGVLVLTEINAHDFYHNLSSFRNMIILANLLFALLIISLAVFYSRQITTPVNELVRSVQAMSQGDLETPIQLKTNDQLQILAREFELLRQRLQEYYQGMEQKIEVRTRELRQAQAQVGHQEKMASLGLMAAGIAHEIGNPLTSISSMAQVIKRKTTDEKITEYVNNILKNIERISRIVRELVDFSKPSLQHEVEADINEIVNSAVSIIKYDRRSKKINFNLDLQPDLPKTLLVPDHLLQVLLNILINAVDASEGLDSEIGVRSHSDNQHIQIDVSDRGCGIAAENINRIFEPFFTTKGVGKGTGLGLTVSYGLIKKLQGEIKVQSQINQGSTFSVVLPLTQRTEAKPV